MSNIDSPKRTSPMCEPQVQHKKGTRYFIIALIFLITSILVGFAQAIFGFSADPVGALIGLTIYSIIALVISIGFWIFLILGIITFFKCEFKSALKE